MIHRVADRIAQIAGIDRLVAGAVRQNSGDNAAGAFGGGHTAKDQGQLSKLVEDRVIKQDQTAVGNDGNENQQHAHCDHRSEHAEALYHKGGHPLFEFSAFIQRHHADKRRGNQIQEDHIKDTRYAVEYDDSKIPDQLARHNNHQNIADTAHIKIRGHLRIVVDAFFPYVIRGAQRIFQGGVIIVNRILRRLQRTHQNHDPVKRNAGAAAATAVLARIRPQRHKRAVCPHDLHAVEQCIGYSGIINIEIQIFVQVRSIDDLLQGGLPCWAGIPVHIVEVKDALLRQILQIRADLIVAVVQVVAAVIRGVQRIVSNRIQYPCHCRILIVLKFNRVLLPQIIRVVEGIIDLCEQFVRKGQHRAQNERQADDNQHPLKHSRQDPAHRLAHFVAGIHRLSRHRDDREHKAEQNADQRHGPIQLLHNGVAEENIHQRLNCSVIADFDHAAHHGKELTQNANDPAKSRTDRIEDRIKSVGKKPSNAA